MRSAHAKALETLMSYQEENDRLRDKVMTSGGNIHTPTDSPLSSPYPRPPSDEYDGEDGEGRAGDTGGETDLDHHNLRSRGNMLQSEDEDTYDGRRVHSKVRPIMTMSAPTTASPPPPPPATTTTVPSSTSSAAPQRSSSAMRAKKVEEILLKGPTNARTASAPRQRPTSIQPTDPTNTKALPASIVNILEKNKGNAPNSAKKMLQRVPPQPPASAPATSTATGKARGTR